jgi:PAS domain S-box-containing protein
MIADKDATRRSHASTKVGNYRGWKNLLAQFTPIQREIQAFFPINPTYFCVFPDLDSCAKVSDNWETLLGWKREVLEAQPWIQWMDAAGVAEWRDRLQSLVRQEKTGDICTLQNRWRHIDGSWRMLSWRISLGPDRRFYGVAELSGELQAAEYQWRQMINKIADGVLILNRDGIVLFANSAAENLFNLPHEELLDLHFGIPNSAKEICEIYLPQKDGSYITVEMRTEQIEWQDQSVYLASLRNISDRQESELRLRESEERYRTLAESSQDLIFILNSDRNLAYINSFGAQLLGIEQPSAIDLEIEEISIIYQFKHLESSIKQVFSLNASVRVEDELVYQGGKLWLDTLLVPLRDNLGKISQILGVARDITQLKSIEQSLRKTQGQLRQREKLLRLTLEQAPIGIVTCDLAGNFLHFNPAFSQILGYSAQKLRQMSWENITDKNDLQFQENHYQKLLAGEVRNFQLENCYLRQDGKRIQGIIRVALIRDAKGSPMHYVAQLEDVTERKQAEAKIQASLKEKEVLLKEIHHRVKNNLQIVSSLLDLQAEYIQEPEILEKLEDSKHRLLAMSLIHETLYQSETLAQVDFSDYVERLATNILFAQSTDYERITLDFNLEPVFLNLETAIPCGLLLNELITNSIKHAFPEPRSGKIYIELHYQSKETASNENQNSCQKEKIMLKVSDNGIGLPANMNFKETKSLGLTLIHDLTQQLRGNLAIDLSNGTEFSLIFSELKYRQRI